MKKFISILVIMLLLCCFTACGGRKNPVASSSNGPSSVSSSTSIDITSESSATSISSTTSIISSASSESSSIVGEYLITIVNVDGGVVTASKTSATAGETITVVVECNQRYTLKFLKVNGVDITSTKSFEMPNSQVEITVEYDYNEHWTPEA